jgi:hypothetical protein
MRLDASETNQFNWGQLVARVLHPKQVAIIEALLWINEPLSAEDLKLLFEDRPSASVMTHHLRRLTKLDAVKIVARARSRRSVTSIAYRLKQCDDHEN